MDQALQSFGGKKPRLGQGVFLASGVYVIGDVELGEGVSIWFNTVLRGDVHWIKVGARTNIQDNSTVHVTSGRAPVTIGAGVTIGHNAIIHGCTIEDDCLIGMGATILDGAVIGRGSFVAAGSLVTPGKVFASRSFMMGSPAKKIREVSDEEYEGILASAAHYMETAAGYKGAVSQL